jgi:hypothetical protein
MASHHQPSTREIFIVIYIDTKNNSFSCYFKVLHVEYCFLHEVRTEKTVRLSLLCAKLVQTGTCVHYR